MLTAIGITPDGKRSVLGCSLALSEAEHHWREFLQSLQERGMRGVKLVVRDDHAGLKAARRLREAVTRYQKTAPQLATWLEGNVPEALAVLRTPSAHRRRLRTTNGLERINSRSWTI